MGSLKKQSIPTVQRGGLKNAAVSNPINKMGVKGVDTKTPFDNSQDQHPLYAIPYQRMVSTSKGVKPIECRLPAPNEIAVIDWVNFTIGIETMGDKYWKDDEFVKDEHLWSAAVDALEPHLEHIFGFSASFCRNSGLNFYEQSYVLGEDFGFYASVVRETPF